MSLYLLEVVCCVHIHHDILLWLDDRDDSASDCKGAICFPRVNMQENVAAVKTAVVHQDRNG